MKDKGYYCYSSLIGVLDDCCIHLKGCPIWIKQITCLIQIRQDPRLFIYWQNFGKKCHPALTFQNLQNFIRDVCKRWSYIVNYVLLGYHLTQWWCKFSKLRCRPFFVQRSEPNKITVHWKIIKFSVTLQLVCHDRPYSYACVWLRYCRSVLGYQPSHQNGALSSSLKVESQDLFRSLQRWVAANILYIAICTVQTTFIGH